MDAEPSCSKDGNKPKRRRNEVFYYDDPDYETKVLRCLEELREEEDQGTIPVINDSDDDSDYEPEQPEGEDGRHSESSTDHEDSALPQRRSSENIPDAGLTNNIEAREVPEIPEYFYGKNRFKWSTKEPNPKTKVPVHNIIKFVPGMKNEVRKLGPVPNAEDIWSLLINDQIIEEIVTWTNVKLTTARGKVNELQNNNYRNTDNIEIRALIGAFLLTAIYKSNHESMLSLFSTKPTGRPIFRAIMSQKRFEILIVAIRFDNPETREERKKSDPEAAILGVFNSFVSNCQKLYSLGEYGCIDEMLIPFRGRCKFRVYMPAKPNKYGIKVLTLTDARTSYFYNAYIYSGKGSDSKGLTEEEKKTSIPTQSVLRLISSIVGSNRNITADNWFSSLELVKELQKRKLTFVGTLRKNKREIPIEFLPNRNREIGSSLYGFSDDITLLSYVPKQNKSVLLISSMHHEKSFDEEKNKPEIVCFYNSTKGGVDSMDQKCANYSSNRRSRRWPLSVFYMLVNISAANSYILYLCFKDSPTITRFKFVEDLAIKLISPHLARRLQMPNIRSDLKILIQNILKEQTQDDENPPVPKSDKLEKRKKCRMCPYSLNRVTAFKCIQCSKPICLQCSKKMCNSCCEDL